MLNVIFIVFSILLINLYISSLKANKITVYSVQARPHVGGERGVAADVLLQGAAAADIRRRGAY